jgi:hypothetical protein
MPWVSPSLTSFRQSERPIGGQVESWLSVTMGFKANWLATLQTAACFGLQLGAEAGESLQLMQQHASDGDVDHASCARRRRTSGHFITTLLADPISFRSFSSIDGIAGRSGLANFCVAERTMLTVALCRAYSLQRLRMFARDSHRLSRFRENSILGGDWHRIPENFATLLAGSPSPF